MIYETASLLNELSKKLPSIDGEKEFKASAVSVTQKCTMESWEHLTADRMIKRAEAENATIAIEDQACFVAPLAILLKRVFMGLLLNNFLGLFWIDEASQAPCGLSHSPVVGLHTETWHSMELDAGGFHG